MLKTVLNRTIILSSTNRSFSISQCCNLIQKWRQERGLPINPNKFGILTDSPDYSFLDGRPTPYGTHQKRRIIEQREIAEKIIKLTAEIDFAVDRHRKMSIEGESKRREILDNKLKPKGPQLLAKK